MEVGPPVAALLALGALLGLAGCTTVHRPITVTSAPGAMGGPDYARKPGAVASNAPDPARDVAWTRTVYATPPQMAVHAGAIALDGGLDLAADAYVGARVAWPLGSALRVEVPVVVAPVSRRTLEPAPPTSTGPPTTRTRHGAIVFVEPGLAWHRHGVAFGRPLETRLGAGVGVACFTGFGDDDVAASGRLTGTLAWRLSPRLLTFLEAEVHGVYTDVGRGDRTLRPVGTLGGGLSWDF